MMLYDSVINDAQYLLWRLHITNTVDHISQERVFASKEMIREVYRIAVSNLYSLMNRLHNFTIHLFGNINPSMLKKHILPPYNLDSDLFC